MFEAALAVGLLLLFLGGSNDKTTGGDDQGGDDQGDADQGDTGGNDTVPGVPVPDDGPGPATPKPNPSDGFGLSGQDQAPEDYDPGASPAEVIDAYMSNDPVLGGGVLLSINNTHSSPSYVARHVLGVSAGHPAIDDYIRAMANESYNLGAYGTPWDPDNKNQPKYTAVDVNGEPWVIAKAWLPRHLDNAARMRAGLEPLRNIDETEKGNPIDPSFKDYGDIWLPRAHVENNELVIDDEIPPPELRELMGEAYV